MKQIYTMLFIIMETFLWSIRNPKEGFICFLEIIPQDTPLQKRQIHVYSSNRFKSALLLLLFWASQCLAITQSDTLKTHYYSLSSIEKVIYYNQFSYNEKKVNRDFFYQNLPKLLLDKKIQSSKKDLIKLKFTLAEAYGIKENHAKALEILKEIENDRQYILSEDEQMNLLVGFQKSYINLSLYSKALKINSEIEKLRKKGVEFPLWSYNIKSDLYARLFLYDKAILQLKLEIKDLLKNPKRDSLIVPSAYNNLGFYYGGNNQIDSAFYYYNLSLKRSEISLKHTNPDAYITLTSLVKGNLGYLYFKQKKYKTAVPFIKIDMAVSLKKSDDINNTIRSVLLLSECYSHLKQYSEAENILKKADPLISNDIDPSEKVHYYKVRAELLKSLHKTEEAYIYYEKAFRLNDSITIKRQRLLLAGNEILYHLEEKDNLIEQQQRDLDLKQHNMLLLLISALFVIMMMSFYFLYNSKNKRKKIQLMNAEISDQNKVIQKSLSEKETLLKEIHHRVKNNLQIISGILELQNETIHDVDTKIILQEGQARIQSIALIHKSLYQSKNFSTVSFQDYLTELVVAIQNAYKKNNLTVKTFINTNSIELDIDTAIPLGLIINEIITNSFKHAFTGKENGSLNIRLDKNQERYILTIEDNGNGLPKNFNLADLKSVGFDLMQGLTKQIGGTFDWKSENGTTITIAFKK